MLFSVGVWRSAIYRKSFQSPHSFKGLTRTDLARQRHNCSYRDSSSFLSFSTSECGSLEFCHTGRAWHPDAVSEVLKLALQARLRRGCSYRDSSPFLSFSTGAENTFSWQATASANWYSCRVPSSGPECNSSHGCQFFLQSVARVAPNH